jgi:hypothetical protein
MTVSSNKHRAYLIFQKCKYIITRRIWNIYIYKGDVKESYLNCIETSIGDISSLVLDPRIWICLQDI